jgi:hypothetical protein
MTNERTGHFRFDLSIDLGRDAGGKFETANRETRHRRHSLFSAE